MSNPIELIIEPKAKDIGGFSVRRVLPYHKRRMVGPFVFFDHLGPATFEPGKGIDVRPHPHIGLATVTYLFEGALLHRDTEDNELVIEPHAVNWMTAGRGISHSERTPERQRAEGHTIHGIQTWVALPKSHEEVAPDFTHHPADTLPRFDLGGAEATLIAGDAYGHSAPVDFPHGIFYLALETDKAATFKFPESLGERCIYVAKGSAKVAGTDLAEAAMAVITDGEDVSVEIAPGSLIMLAGGEPMDGPRFMDWNFVSSSKERIEQAKEDWRLSAEKWWEGTPFAMPPNENEYIPVPGDSQIEPK